MYLSRWQARGKEREHGWKEADTGSDGIGAETLSKTQLRVTVNNGSLIQSN